MEDRAAALAAGTGLEIICCHFPPGTARYPKWNKIGHRLFSHLTMNWRGRPLTSRQVILDSIAATTATGLTVTARLDDGHYAAGIQVTSAQPAALQQRALTRHGFHGTWNGTVPPAAAGPAPGPDRPPPAGAALSAAPITALPHPALTGMPGQDLAALATALPVPFRAAREQRLCTQRGGPRRNVGRPARALPRQA